MTAQARGIRTTCDTCGANMAWDAGAGALRCEACGATRAADVPPAAAIVEHDLEAALRAPRPRGSVGIKQVKCTECGAVVQFGPNVAATRCEFCDSPQVLAQELASDRFLPESLVPFKVGRDQAVAAFKRWLSGLWFRPSNLRAKASIAELHGVYVPYWTFDAHVESHWTADAGYYYWENESYTTTENGRTVRKTRRVRKIRWQPASGRRFDRWDDHLVCASRGLPDDLARKIRSFDTRTALVPWAPEYLQGYSAESYAVELPDAWQRASQEIAREQERRCARDVPGDTHRNLRASHRMSQTTFKHVLLPLWIAAFRYDDQLFRFLVNGQTGEVAGKAPWSVTKIVLFVATIVALSVAAYVIFGR